MKKFKEVLLDNRCLSPQTVYLPKGAEPVAVLMKDKGLVVITLCDASAEDTELRTFKICAIDENIYSDTVRYIGSFDSIIGTRYLLEYIRGE